MTEAKWSYCSWTWIFMMLRRRDYFYKTDRKRVCDFHLGVLLNGSAKGID